MLKTYDFYDRFRAVVKLPRDEVHLSVRCFLVMPDRARFPRLCRGLPRPCSRRVPPGRAVFAFLQESAVFLVRFPTWYRLAIAEIFVSERVRGICSSLTSKSVVTPPNPPRGVYALPNLKDKIHWLRGYIVPQVGLGWHLGIPPAHFLSFKYQHVYLLLVERTSL